MTEALYIIIGICGFLLIFGLITVITSRNRIKKQFEKQIKIGNSKSITGAQVAVFVRDKYGLDISFARTKNDLADAYYPKKKVLIMSDKVCDTPSIASVAIVSHELGHALQHKSKNKLFKTNMVLSKITRITNKLIFPLIVVGLILYICHVPTESFGLILVVVAGGLFLMHALLKLLTIPLEYDASRRALKLIQENKLLTKKEIAKTKKLLNNAGETYILALFDDIMKPLNKLKKTLF